MIRYITLMDGTVVPYDDKNGLPAGAMPPGANGVFGKPNIATQYDADLSLPTRPGNVDPSRVNQDKPMYGTSAYAQNLINSELQKYPNDPVMNTVSEANRSINNIFGEYNPGGAGQIGGGNRRVGDRESRVVTLPNGTKKRVFVNRDTTGDYFPDTSFADRAMMQANYTDPQAPNYVKPPENLFNIDFGGTGTMGMSGQGAFTTPFNEAFSSDVSRFVDDLNNLDTAGLASEGVQVSPEVDAHFKLLAFPQTASGQQFMYKNDKPAYTKDTYLLPSEMATKLGFSTEGINSQSELIQKIDSILKSQKNTTFSKETFNMGGSGVKDSIDVSKVGGLFAKNIEEKAKDRKAINDAKSRQGETIGDKLRNIFSDPYQDYVDADGRTIRGTYQRTEDETLLKKQVTNGQEIIDDKLPSGFTKDNAMDLLGMYLQMGSLTRDAAVEPMKPIAMSPSPGLKLETGNLYKRNRRT